MGEEHESVLSAPYVLEYTYQRSTGPVIGRFLAALKEGRLEGARTAAGRVIVPPVEYDPDSGAAIKGFVPLPPTGTIVNWSWVSAPRNSCIQLFVSFWATLSMSSPPRTSSAGPKVLPVARCQVRPRPNAPASRSSRTGTG